ncbi:MAG: asparaginase [Deltaproteobacteria bacterium]|nr:asparaginase [Deltaproteobacteria bacterium]
MPDSPHPHPHGHAHANGATPVLVEVTRGAMVESRHRGHATVVDSEGGVVMSWGEAEATI